MARSEDLFAGARVTTRRIAPGVRGLLLVPRQGTVVGPEETRVDAEGEYKIVCKCGCGGYWAVRWDGVEAQHGTISFLAHDLDVFEIVDQLAFRAKDDGE